MGVNLPNRSGNKIDEVQILPRKGVLYHLRGPGHSGKSMRAFAEAWTAMVLMNGEYVHWIDGACRFNPATIIKNFPHSIPDSEQLLHGLFVGRGFTVHQFAHLIERLQHEIKITRAKLVVIDGPITMHLDPQINDYESRSLLRKSMNILSQIAVKYNTSLVVITSNKPYSQRHASLLTMVENRCPISLLGKPRRINGEKKLWLLHLPSRSSGYYEQRSDQETLYESTSKVIHSRLSIERIEEIE
jgi:hypothetical protein